ncbi:MAG: glyoxalase [Bacteroidota bacterium]
MDLNRDESLKQLRPEIPRIDPAAATNPAEQFQNKTLRPILKLQNALLVEAFHHYFNKRKKVFYGLSKSKKKGYIEQALQKDLNFRNRVIGLICGHFSIEEWREYVSMENELSRRLITMSMERMKDQLV